jgi:hypothetical protein
MRRDMPRCAARRRLTVRRRTRFRRCGRPSARPRRHAAQARTNAGRREGGVEMGNGKIKRIAQLSELFALGQAEENHSRGNPDQIAETADGGAQGQNQFRAERQHCRAAKPAHDQGQTHENLSGPSGQGRRSGAGAKGTISVDERIFTQLVRGHRRSAPALSWPPA